MAKSDSVQYKFREILVDPNILASLSSLSTEGELSPEDKDELIGLTEDLLEYVKNIIDTKLTERQSQIIKLIYFERKTQMEVAYVLGLCQTTIHKVLYGNIDYLHGGKRYGGAIKKIRKLCSSDLNVCKILQRIEEINSIDKI
jgi:hypothetical protein